METEPKKYKEVKTKIKVRRNSEGKLEIKKELNGVDVQAFLAVLRDVEGYVNNIDIEIKEKGYDNFTITLDKHTNSKNEVISYNFKDIEHEPKYYDPLEVIKDCEEFFELPFEEITAKTRKQEICKKRQFIMSLLYILTIESNDGVSSYFNKDGATVVHARVRAVPSYIESKDKELLYWIEYFSNYYHRPELLNKMLDSKTLRNEQ